MLGLEGVLPTSGVGLGTYTDGGGRGVLCASVIGSTSGGGSGTPTDGGDTGGGASADPGDRKPRIRRPASEPTTTSGNGEESVNLGGVNTLSKDSRQASRPWTLNCLSQYRTSARISSSMSLSVRFGRAFSAEAGIAFRAFSKSSHHLLKALSNCASVRVRFCIARLIVCSSFLVSSFYALAA